MQVELDALDSHQRSVVGQSHPNPSRNGFVQLFLASSELGFRAVGIAEDDFHLGATAGFVLDQVDGFGILFRQE